MSDFAASSSTSASASQVSAFRGPGRMAGKSTSHDPILISDTLQAIDVVSTESQDFPSSNSKMVLNSPQDSESNKRVLSEPSVKRQASKGLPTTAQHGGPHLGIPPFGGSTATSSHPSESSTQASSHAASRGGGVARPSLLGPLGSSILAGHPQAPSHVAQLSLYGGALSCLVPASFRDVSDVRPVPDHQEVWHDCGPARDEARGGKSGDAREGGGGKPGKMDFAKDTSTPSSAAADDESSDSGPSNSASWLTSPYPGACVVFEILSRDSSVPDAFAAQYYFTDLAEANGCQCLSPSSLDPSWVSPATLAKDYLSVHPSPPTVDCCIDWIGHFPNLEIFPELSRTRDRCFATLAVGRQRLSVTRGASPCIVWVSTAVLVLRLAAVQVDMLLVYTRDVEEGGGGAVEGAGAAGGKTGEIYLPVDNVFKMVLETFKIEDWTLFC